MNSGWMVFSYRFDFWCFGMWWSWATAVGPCPHFISSKADSRNHGILWLQYHQWSWQGLGGWHRHEHTHLVVASSNAVMHLGYSYLILPDHEILAFGSPDKKAWFCAEDLPRYWTNRPVDQWRCSLDIGLQHVRIYRHRCNDTTTRKCNYTHRIIFT